MQEDNHTGIRFTKYHLLLETKVFVANFYEELAAGKPDQFKSGGKIFGTVSFVVDSPMGLSVQEFCGEKVSEM